MSESNGHKEQSPNYSFPSSEKNGELALFFNLAYNRINKFILTLQPELDNQNKGGNPWEIRYLLFDYGKLNDCKERIEKSLLNDSVYALFKELVLKDKTGKNRYAAPGDIKTINHVLLLLLRLRDYHSHYWHEKTTLVNFQLKKYLQSKLETAKNAYNETGGKIKPFDIFDGDCLNSNGINFFLGFFLTKGMMQLFMGQREGLKNRGLKNEGGVITDYDYHRHICTYYTLRDGHKRASAFLEKKELPDYNEKELLSLTLYNHLQAVPDFLYHLLKEEELGTAVQKGKNIYQKLLVYWLSQQYNGEIQWQGSPVTENVKQQKTQKRGTETIPESYTKEVRKFSTHPGFNKFEIEPTAGKENIITRIDISDKKKVQLTINTSQLMPWALLCLKDEKYKTGAVLKLKEYCTEMAGLIDSIDRGTKYNFSGTMINSFAYPPENNNPMIPGIFLEMNDNSKISDEDYIAETRKSVKKRLEFYINLYKSENEEPLKLSKLKTEIFETAKRIKGIFQGKKKTELTEPEQKQLKEWVAERRLYKNIRHRKMEVIFRCLRLLLGKKAKFITSDMKNDFMRYVYLLDFPVEQRRINLIANWRDRLTVIHKAMVYKKELSPEKIKEKEEKRRVYQDKVLNLLNTSQRFDKFYDGIISLTSEKLDNEYLNIDKQSDEGVIYLARLYHIKNISLSKSRDSKVLNRKEELLKAFRNKKTLTYYVPLPEYFFKHVFNEYKIDEEIRNLREGKGKEFYIMQKERYKKLSSSEAAEYFEGLKENVNIKKSAGSRKVINEKLKKIRQLDIELLRDSLLYEIYKKIEAGAEKDWKWTGIKEMKYKVTPEVEITAAPREIRANDNLIQGSHIKRILERLWDKDKHKNSYTLNEIKQELRNHWYDSRRFLSELLNYEKKFYLNKKEKTGKTLNKINNNNFYKNSYERIGFKEINTNFENNNKLSQIKKARNTAFHGSVLDKQLNYEDYTNELKKL